jgi:outer membrane protein OmpA-like peptidoglycan-associated protein
VRTGNNASESIFYCPEPPRSIFFQAGHPVPGESLADSVMLPSGKAFTDLQFNLDLLKQYEKLHVDIVGSADKSECTGTSCDSLSLRRAEAIQAWLLHHGARPEQIRNVSGIGTNLPLDRGDTPEATQLNRRVETNVSAD